MIYKTLSELVHLDDDLASVEEAHIQAIKQAVEHGGNAQISITLSLKKKPKLVEVLEDENGIKEFPCFELERKIKVVRPVPRGKESVSLGVEIERLYVDGDGEIVTHDELPIKTDVVKN
ncbi:hypothetical protein [Acinetobacter parvus]|uniref:hypothetical protein n=1 Tax=Acinetobacter parvus TaxID=134533 RepID=UPI0021D0B05B|nr:hypothetical protein [Acinetobacter parvus]MCU4393359.1 hypothetical protein [Acinetobacter parvus]